MFGNEIEGFESLALTEVRVDGAVQSFLVGGQDVFEVMNRTDTWYCVFYE